MYNMNYLIILTLFLAVLAIAISYKKGKSDNIPPCLIIMALSVLVYQRVFTIRQKSVSPSSIEGFQTQIEQKRNNKIIRVSKSLTLGYDRVFNTSLSFKF